MRTSLSILILSCALLAGLASPASADDASIKRAWDSEDAAFTTLGKSVAREFDRWARRGHTRDSKLLSLLRRGETLTRTVEQRVNAEQPSSPSGTEAKNWALRSLATFAAHFVAERKAVRAAPGARAQRLGREADRLAKRSETEAKEAKKHFAAAGIT